MPAITPENISMWASLVATLINLGIATEQQIAAAIKANAGPSDTDPEVMAQTASMMQAIRLQLAEIRARAVAEANRTE
jgi:hypothetical protein